MWQCRSTERRGCHRVSSQIPTLEAFADYFAQNSKTCESSGERGRGSKLPPPPTRNSQPEARTTLNGVDLLLDPAPTLTLTRGGIPTHPLSRQTRSTRGPRSSTPLDTPGTALLDPVDHLALAMALDQTHLRLSLPPRMVDSLSPLRPPIRWVLCHYDDHPSLVTCKCRQRTHRTVRWVIQHTSSRLRSAVWRMTARGQTRLQVSVGCTSSQCQCRLAADRFMAVLANSPSNDERVVHELRMPPSRLEEELGQRCTGLHMVARKEISPEGSTGHWRALFSPG